MANFEKVSEYVMIKFCPGGGLWGMTPCLNIFSCFFHCSVTYGSKLCIAPIKHRREAQEDIQTQKDVSGETKQGKFYIKSVQCGWHYHHDNLNSCTNCELRACCRHESCSSCLLTFVLKIIQADESKDELMNLECIMGEIKN